MCLGTKYHMQPVGECVRMPGGDIQYLELAFKIQGPLQKAEARKVLVHACQDFLGDLNSDARLCGFLKNHSLSIEEVGITILPCSASGGVLHDPEIGKAELIEGIALYSTFEQGSAFPSLKWEYEESYEEALYMLSLTMNEASPYRSNHKLAQREGFVARSSEEVQQQKC
ncbi:MAG: hypothetical protein JSR80_06925 [Verrucomicrobia bacterium]|nr:hypothetical protein [Verrucomicrobiota bacterium]